METNHNISCSAVIITYGDLNNVPGLKSLVVADVAGARTLALEFIKVIPDSLDDYVIHINSWAGAAALTITHQDDDTFFFNAVPVYGCFMEPTKNISEFHTFIADNNAE